MTILKGHIHTKHIRPSSQSTDYLVQGKMQNKMCYVILKIQTVVIYSKIEKRKMR